MNQQTLRADHIHNVPIHTIEPNAKESEIVLYYSKESDNPESLDDELLLQEIRPGRVKEFPFLNFQV